MIKHEQKLGSRERIWLPEHPQIGFLLPHHDDQVRLQGLPDHTRDCFAELVCPVLGRNQDHELEGPVMTCTGEADMGFWWPCAALLFSQSPLFLLYDCLAAIPRKPSTLGRTHPTMCSSLKCLV